MDLGPLSQILKDYFQILSESQPQPYKIRFIGSPYNAFVADCRSLVITAHHRAGSRGMQVAPIVVSHILRKFEIPENDFRNAYNTYFSRQANDPSPRESGHESGYVN